MTRAKCTVPMADCLGFTGSYIKWCNLALEKPRKLSTHMLLGIFTGSVGDGGVKGWVRQNPVRRYRRPGSPRSFQGKGVPCVLCHSHFMPLLFRSFPLPTHQGWLCPPTSSSILTKNRMMSSFQKTKSFLTHWLYWASVTSVYSVILLLL